eukprot:3099317-Ditylum_brightwellii.AAC.1
MMLPQVQKTFSMVKQPSVEEFWMCFVTSSLDIELGAVDYMNGYALIMDSILPACYAILEVTPQHVCQPLLHCKKHVRHFCFYVMLIIPLAPLMLESQWGSGIGTAEWAPLYGAPNSTFNPFYLTQDLSWPLFQFNPIYVWFVAIITEVSA